MNPQRFEDKTPGNVFEGIPGALFLNRKKNMKVLWVTVGVISVIALGLLIFRPDIIVGGLTNPIEMKAQ